MDLEHMQNCVNAERRFIQERGLSQTDLFSLICALKVNNYTAMQAMVTTNVGHCIPHLIHGAGLIYDYIEDWGGNISIAPRAERASVGEWLVHFDNLLHKITEFICSGSHGDALGLIGEMYSAMLSAAYANNGTMRRGYEQEKTKVNPENQTS